MRLKKINNKQQGFSLVTAIFILVILAALSGVAINIMGIMYKSTSLISQGENVYFAARSGMEWGIYQVINTNTCPSTTSLNFTQGSLKNLTATINCFQQAVTEGNTTYNIFFLTVLGEDGKFPNPDYVSRQLQSAVTVGN